MTGKYPLIGSSQLTTHASHSNSSILFQEKIDSTLDRYATGPTG
jgi:hypothetical protein